MMSLKEATLRVPLKDHECSVELSDSAISCRPIRLVVDGQTFFMTAAGAEALASKISLVSALAREGNADR